MFLFGVKKTFALHYFQTPKNCILEALGNQMCICPCKPLLENICSRDVGSFYLVRGVLNNFPQAARCLGLVIYFKILKLSF